MAAKRGGGGGGGGAGGIRAGRAFVELFADDNLLRRGLARAQSMVRNFGAGMAKVGGGIGLAGAGILGPLAPLFKDGIGKAAEMGDLSSIFGMSAESASKMSHAFEVTGNSTEDLKKALGKLSETADGRPLDEYFLDTVDALLAIPDAAERMAKARELFGEKAAFRILDAGQDLRRLMGGAPLISEASQKAAEEFEQSMAAIKAHIIAAILPAIQVLAPAMEKVLHFVKENRAAIAGIALAGVGLTAIGTALVAGGMAAMGLSAAIGAVSAVIGALLTPVGLVAAAVVGLGIAFFTLTDLGREAGQSIGRFWSTIADDVMDAFAGIQAAFSLGDWQMMGDIAVATLELMWERIKRQGQLAWDEIGGYFTDAFHDAIYLIRLGFEDLVTWLSKKFFAVALAIGREFGEKAISAPLKAAAAVFEALGLDEKAKTWREAAAAIPAILAAPNAQRIFNQIADNKRDRNKDRITKEKEAAQAERDAERAANRADADKAVNDAKGRLDSLTGAAQAAAAAMAAGEFAAGLAARVKLPGASMAALPEFAQGTFGGASLNRFFTIGRAAEDIARRHLDVDEEALAELKKINVGRLR